ncbi:YiaA/YiaB family inner membrane protein [Nocardia sp. CDC160]|uniref:YiaA/YiaB family inner membrane protein n=1 Tax=Nocardia sp. CDC160 TaxID=3112166 RepID=UPI002DBCD953|nr:YiaA/YiaB family inner membrane protein [Nocardia sp. CDC160]MEC3913586.1 YiaA/YiaB family inner membrane protein [Nocardia sp. CDC160]
MSTPSAPTKSTTAFLAQATIAFGISFCALIIGIAYLPLDIWQRGFLLMAMLFLVSSTFTLAKVIRDQHESSKVTQRIDEARMEKLMAEHDPFKIN